MEVYYINHKNQKIDLGRPPYQMQVGNVFNFSHKYEGSNFKLKRIYKEITTISTTITISSSDDNDFFDALNTFFEVTEADTVSELLGRLYIGEYYLSCNVISSDKSFWKEMFDGVEISVKLLVPYPYWCREETKSFLKYNQKASRAVGGNLSYPFGYPYKYPMPRNVGFLKNNHYAPCDFKMIVFGPCTDPAVRINGHLYEVVTTLFEGEYMVIDSRDHTVIRYSIDGEAKSIFNSRNTDSNLFEKIPSGNCSVLWNIDSFGFDITLFQERSEPKWSL